MIKSLARKTGTLGYLTQIKAIATTRRLSDPKTKFVVYSQGRSGSHVLLELLKTHPDVYVDGSLIGQRVIAPFSYLRFRSRRGGSDVYGFKVKPFHFTLNGFPDAKFFDHLDSRDWKFIHLVRNNKLKQALSNSYAGAIGKGHVPKGEQRKRIKFAVSIPQIIATMEKRIEIGQHEDQLMSNYAHLRVSYEDDLLPQDAHQATSNKAFNWLGIHPHDGLTDLQPSTPKKMSDFISNFDELRVEITNRGLTQFLDPE